MKYKKDELIGATANSIKESNRQLMNYYKEKVKQYKFLIIDILDMLIKTAEMLDNGYIDYKITQYQDRLRILRER